MAKTAPCTTKGCHKLHCLWWQDAITRVQSLEKMGHLSGVMDDRGKVSNTHQLCCIACSNNSTSLNLLNKPLLKQSSSKLQQASACKMRVLLVVIDANCLVVGMNVRPASAHAHCVSHAMCRWSFCLTDRCHALNMAVSLEG